MPETETKREWVGRRGAAVALAVLLVAGCAVYLAGVPGTPPGFYIDESSISYNAHLIARTGRDEHGARLPLFFRAFGEYKNPVHVYLLAAVFTVTGPSVAAARGLSALLGVAAALALGLLGYRLTGRRDAGLLTFLTALLTPWLFELSRLVFEVALYPLALALFLLAVLRASDGRGCASDGRRWSWADAAPAAAGLALLTYTYSVGRLLAPLFALGLVLFARRAGLASVLRVWLLYALALAPLVVFHFQHPNALSSRFRVLTYLTSRTSAPEAAREFASHYLANLDPWRLLVTGDPTTLIVSVNGAGQVLAATFVLAAAGAVLALRRDARRKSFWLYVLYGLAVAPAPASLTADDFHLLRLAAVPVFLVVLAAPAFAWLAEGAGGSSEGGSERGAGLRRGWRRAALAAAVALTVLQGAAFMRLYHAEAHTPERRAKFDADYYSNIMSFALGRPERPVYLADKPGVPGYIQAYWHSLLRGVSRANFQKLAPAAPVPAGALVITTEDNVRRCRALAEVEPYRVCLAEGEPNRAAPLPAEGFRAEFVSWEVPARIEAGGKRKITVRLRNASGAWWRARERVAEPFQVAAANRWLDARTGAVVVPDNGRGAIPRDLAPGEEALITFTVNAPKRAGDYLLELDVLQEGVSWFGPRGSQTVRVPVKVE